MLSLVVAVVVAGHWAETKEREAVELEGIAQMCSVKTLAEIQPRMRLFTPLEPIK
jgi:hypothetical protein